MSDPLLDVKDLRVWFPIRRGVISRTVGHVRAVDGVSLSIGEGEVLGLVGESGCGKSTLARAILRLETPREGTIRYAGRDITQASGRQLADLRRHVQVVFQDPYASLNPRMTIMDIVTEGPLEHGLIPAREREQAAADILGDVGLGRDALHRYPHEFSGGQRQRIGIARALAMKPKLIICDEAVSALDVSVQAQVINLLSDLRASHGLSYLFITHDLSVVRYIADRVAVMYYGKIVETGPCETVMHNPSHDYTKKLLAAIPVPGRKRGELET